MIDFPFGLKPFIASTGPDCPGNAASTFDWVNCEGMHRLHCIVSLKRAVTKPAQLTISNASASNGGGTAALTSTGAAFWYQKSTIPQIDRLWEQTTTQSSGTNIFMIPTATGMTMLVGTLECAALPYTSKPWVAFGLADSSQAGNIASAIYLAEPRYPGYQQFVATTSST